MKYSIIIPHYNLASLLERCLRSIPVREDIQTIVVDDMSNDEELGKLHQLQERFPHIQFIFCKKNGGGGAARNIGLSKAAGDYILFADADDYFCDGFEKLLDKYASKDNDITFFNVNFVDSETNEKSSQSNYVAKIIEIYKKNNFKGEILLRYSFGEPWCKMIRRTIVQEKNIQFDQINIHNDTRFSYLVGYHAKKLAVCLEPIYNYTIRSGSVSKSISDEKILTRTKVFAQKNKFLKERNIPFFDELMLRSFKYCKKNNNFELYQQCQEIATHYGFDKGFVNRKLVCDRIFSFFKRKKKKIKSFF